MSERTRLIALIILTTLLYSCNNNPLAKKVNPATAEQDIASIKSNPENEFANEDYLHLEEYVKGMLVGKVILGKDVEKIEVKTYGDVLNKSMKRRLSIDSLNNLMKNNLPLFALKIDYKEYEGDGVFGFYGETENHFDKAVDGFQGYIYVSDKFKDTLAILTLEMDTVIHPNDTVRYLKMWDLDKFTAKTDKLKSLPSEKLILSWEPTKIIFSDGTMIHK